MLPRRSNGDSSIAAVCSPGFDQGSWLWVRPGQIQQWGDVELAEGALILFERDFLDLPTVTLSRLDEPDLCPLLTPVGEDRVALRTAAAHLEGEWRDRGNAPLEAHVLILRQLLAALILRIAHIQSPGSQVAGRGEPYRQFRAAVDRDFARTRRVEDYARSLGYSARTLTRATLAADGVTAKEFIDRCRTGVRGIAEAIPGLLVHAGGRCGAPGRALRHAWRASSGRPAGTSSGMDGEGMTTGAARLPLGDGDGGVRGEGRDHGAHEPVRGLCGCTLCAPRGGDASGLPRTRPTSG
ncbi:hypothetical protein [Actinacidiphila sp. bgisy167]|uniref:hypothetical protein n=1 Tax=Actinacidiphila sp. bgisy167 TaxID=3413797 RepID=UPI003D752448